jgi:hypothetical protein
MNDAVVRVKKAVWDLRLLGILFLAMATFIVFVFGFNRRGPFRQMPLALAGVFIVQVLPATGYMVASILLPRHSMRAARLAMWLSFLQPLLAVAAIAVGVLFEVHFRGGRGMGQMTIIAGAVVVFFIPALIAQGFQLWRAMRDINLLPQSQHGFEPIPMAKAAGPDEP